MPVAHRVLRLGKRHNRQSDVRTRPRRPYLDALWRGCALRLGARCAV